MHLARNRQKAKQLDFLEHGMMSKEISTGLDRYRKRKEEAAETVFKWL